MSWDNSTLNAEGWGESAVSSKPEASASSAVGTGAAAGGWGASNDNEATAAAAAGPEGDDSEAEYAEEVEGEFMSGLLEGANDVNVKLADKQADVNSPLYSAKNFEQLGLDENLLKGIYAMKFVKPSKVQERALPLLLGNPATNLIAQSQSGTGKTAAFALSMLSRVDSSEAYPQAVCVAPTRELARQIIDVVRQMGQYTPCTSALLLREEGAPFNAESGAFVVSTSSSAPADPSNLSANAYGGGAADSRKPVTAQIVVGTPGTINEYERKRLLDLSKAKIFVLDEADVMLDKQGMGIQSLRVKRACPENVQSVFFSATFTPSVLEFAHRIAPNANEITLKRDELSVDAIKQFFMDCDSFPHKFEMLSALYGLLTVSQSIIFVATRNAAEQVQAHMEREGYTTSVLHGGMSPEQRDDVIDNFRAGKSKVLITTNVLARGIDVLPVNLVVNFDMPMTMDRRPDPETYLHRIGRTGRFGRAGVSINFVHSRESLQVMLAIQEYFGREIVRLPTQSVEHLQQKLSQVLGDK